MTATPGESPSVTLAVGPEEIQSYLAGSGWARSAASRVAQIWTPSERHPNWSEDLEVLVPNIASAPDFDLRLDLLVKDLQSFEMRPGEEIRDEMSRQFVDVTNIAAEHSYDSSVFPLDASHKLFFSAKKMVVAAAAATLRRRGYFGHSIPKRAREQARGVLVGHTRPGSYVVPVISRARLPVASWDDNQPQLVEGVEEASFDRRMVATMGRALHILHELAVVRDAEPSNRDVVDGVGEGLSYEICEGVIHSLKDTAVEDFKVGFDWAPAIAPPQGLDAVVAFPSDSLPRLRRVARGLRKDIEDREQVVYGWVQLLSSKAQDVGGWIHLHAMVGGRQRMIRMTLDAEDYEKAVTSHKRFSVMVRGDLHLEEGKQATMDVHSFDLEQPLPGV